MMKKIKFKSLKLTSPRKERRVHSGEEKECQSSHSSQTETDSPDNSYYLPDEPQISPTEACQTFPKSRKAGRNLFSTLRKKFTSQKRKDEDDRKTWHGHEFDGPDGRATMVASSRTTRRVVHKPVRPAHSEERLCDPSPPFRRTRQHIRAISADRNKDRCNGFCVKPELSSKSEDESEKEESFHCDTEDGKSKEMLPIDTEYGHASAPVANDINSGNGISRTGYNQSEHYPDEENAEPLAGGAASHLEEAESSDHERNEDLFMPHLTVQPFYDQVKETSKIWNLTHELFKLSKYGWYWGPITRMEAEEKLSNQPDGAFLVRDSSDERYLLSLSFRSYGRTLHTRIEHCNGVFSFYAHPECEGYSSVVDLIEHSMTDSQTGVFCYSRARTPGSPSFPVRLTKPVSRFTQVRSLQYLCRFVIRQYTRYDHIQKLPLPTSIKGWLEENQY